MASSLTALFSERPPFYGRDRELDALRAILKSPRAEMFLLSGRRGVGKSALLEQTLSETPVSAVFFCAGRRTLPLLLASLTDAAREAFPAAFLPKPFANFANFLEFASEQAEELLAGGSPQSVTLVLDEFPNLADANPDLPATLAAWWDRQKRHAPIKVILSGSVLDSLTASKAPLAKRTTGALRLQPLDYLDSALFFPKWSPTEKMLLYAVLGGLPSCVEQFDPTRSVAENIRSTLLKPGHILCQEPDWQLMADLRRDATSASILRAIASGCRKPSEIARAIGKRSAQDVTLALETLRHMELVRRALPVTERKQSGARNSQYLLAENYHAFWYRFVDPNRTALARGRGEQLWEQAIAPVWQAALCRPAFAQAARQYLWRAQAGRSLPKTLTFTDVGAWWGKDNRKFDIVAVDARGEIVLAGSSHWTNAAVDLPEFTALQKEAAVLRGRNEPTLALFSRAGFTPRLQAAVSEQRFGRLLLIDLKTMYAV